MTYQEQERENARIQEIFYKWEIEKAKIPEFKRDIKDNKPLVEPTNQNSKSSN
jgi:hypothetical protein